MTHVGIVAFFLFYNKNTGEEFNGEWVKGKKSGKGSFRFLNGDIYAGDFQVMRNMQHTVTSCNTLQHSATHCNALQHTATHGNTL